MMFNYTDITQFINQVCHWLTFEFLSFKLLKEWCYKWFNLTWWANMNLVLWDELLRQWLSGLGEVTLLPFLNTFPRLLYGVSGLTSSSGEWECFFIQILVPFSVLNMFNNSHLVIIEFYSLCFKFGFFDDQLV